MWAFSKRLSGKSPVSASFLPADECSRLPPPVAESEYLYINERRIAILEANRRTATTSASALGDPAPAAESKVPASGCVQGSNDTGRPVHPPEGLIGLALSGGGLRSAMFNAGIVQSLVRKGFFKDVDYLCTISGGGYCGGHLTALSHQKELEYRAKEAHCARLKEKLEALQKSSDSSEALAGAKSEFEECKKKLEHSRLARYITCEDLGVDCNQRLTSRYRLRDAGHYLIRSWLEIMTALGTWLAGTALITVPTVLCGLTSVALLAALLWRCCDLEAARDIIHFVGIPSLSLYLGLSDETLIAFIPAFVLTIACFVLCWSFNFSLQLLIQVVRSWPWISPQGSAPVQDLAGPTAASDGNSAEQRRFIDPIVVSWNWIFFLTTSVGLASLLISCAVLLGNGEMQPDEFTKNVNDYPKTQSNWFSPLFITAVISSLPWYALRFVARTAKPDATGPRGKISRNTSHPGIQNCCVRTCWIGNRLLLC
jgi:hypothetical protein